VVAAATLLGTFTCSAALLNASKEKLIKQSLAYFFKRPNLFFHIIFRFFQGILGTRFGSLEFQIGFLQSEKIIIGSLKSEKSGPYRSILGT